LRLQDEDDLAGEIVTTELTSKDTVGESSTGALPCRTRNRTKRIAAAGTMMAFF